MFNYMSPEVLRGFDKYQYCSVDNSPLSKYVTHPFWNWSVQFFPKWLAPNVMTFSGFLILVANFLLLSYYDWSFDAAELDLQGQLTVPSWVWLVCGVGTFVAHTLDGCDGKQARRTKSSTPLGELFDHGLDSWACLLLPGALYSVFGRGQYGADEFGYYYVLVFVMFSFILSHWEKYNTGILFLPWTYDLSQVGITVAFLVQYLYAFTWTRVTLPYVNVTISAVGLSVFAVLLVVLGVGVACMNVIRSYRDKSGNMLSLSECIRPLVPCLLWFSLITTWIYISPTNILHHHTRMVYTLMGTVFSNITCRLIVNQMSKTRCDIFNALVLPGLIIVPLVYLSQQAGLHEDKLLLIYTVMAAFAHIHYGTNIVKQMADRFNICVFSLAKPEKIYTKRAE